MFFKKGDKGEEVKQLQLLLSNSGFNCGIADGIFGPKTEMAVKLFQEKYNIAIDGIAGPITLGLLTNPTQLPSLWYPEAITLDLKKYQMVARGKFRYNYPEGMVWHFTAGWRSKYPVGHEQFDESCADKAQNTISSSKRSGYGFLVIDGMGRVYQQFPLNQRCWHAGSKTFNKLGANTHFVGVEVMAAGKLKQQKDGTFKTWFDQTIPDTEVVYTDAKENIQKGHYHNFTEAQCVALKKLTLWLYRNNPKVFKIENVCSHDEVTQYKNDIGPCYYGKTMREIREELLAEVK